MTPHDRIREAIRAAVSRANPIEEARRSIELIAETSVRFSEADGQPSTYIVDGGGQRRTKSDGGRTVDFTIDDLIAEIRTKHPALFARSGRAAAPAPAPVRELPPQPAQAAVAAPMPVAAAPVQPTRRDWLDLGGSEPAPAAPETPEPAADLPRAPRVEAASSSPKARGWFRMLGSAGPVIRIASNGMASRLSGLRSGLPSGEVPGGVRIAGQGLRRVMGPVLRASAAVVLLLIGGSVVYALGSLFFRADDPATRTASVSAPREPATTGSVSATRVSTDASPAARATDAAPIRGVPEVLDTATLSIHGKVVRLFGIEWVRGAGEPSDLASYIRGREVSCEPAKPGSATYRCEVEGQDLSKVVLFNGGGRATSEASPDLQAAEAHAKASRTGLWAKGS